MANNEFVDEQISFFTKIWNTLTQQLAYTKVLPI